MPWKSPSRPRSSLVVPVATAGFDGRLPAMSRRKAVCPNADLQWRNRPEADVRAQLRVRVVMGIPWIP